MKRFKDLPLFLQISLVIGVITIFISTVMLVVLPHTLRDFFTKEMYNTIEAAQSSFIRPEDFNNIENIPSDDIRTVKHLILYPDGQVKSQVDLDMDFFLELKSKALRQKLNKENYMYNNGKKIFYTIRKVRVQESFLSLVQEREAYLVSFLNDSYREDLVATLFKKLVSLSIVILLISFIPALILSKYLSRPLVDLTARVNRLGERKWEDPVLLDRADEIGQLGASVEKLRLELLRQDRLEQNFLQNISHELKTPIMVIKSYSEAIRDGIYPGGNLESSLDVIGEETTRLEKKVKSLLYITKLDYMSSFKLEKSCFNLFDLLSSLVEKYRLLREDLHFGLEDFDLYIEADPEQLQIVFENIFDNMLRYARSEILLSLEDKTLKIYNDGEKISEKDLGKIFNKFHKGMYGEVGLGLSIVKKIMDLHGFKIYAKNEAIGLAFYLDFNKED